MTPLAYAYRAYQYALRAYNENPCKDTRLELAEALAEFKNLSSERAMELEKVG